MAHSGVVLLFGAAAGYWVLERASAHKGSLKRTGEVLGWVMIITSLAGLACGVWAAASGRCAPGGKGAMCPFSSKMSGNPASGMTP